MLRIFIALAALLCTAPPAQATVFLNFNGSTGVFGNNLVDSPTFDDVIDLGSLTPGAYLISATISSNYQQGNQAAQNIDFLSVMFNNVEFSVGMTGQNEFRFINSIATGNTNLFQVRGTSGVASSYAGTINIAAIPEPSSWAMMIVGFLAVGAAIRRRPPGRVLLRQAV